MSPNLKPLILPQLVQERRKWDIQQVNAECDLSYVYYTTNSSSSDVASPVTPTFSPKGHFRMSSSASSLDLPPQLNESPVSPTQSVHPKAPMRLLPDVQEEPLEPEHEDDSPDLEDHFGLYSCLCDEPCEHRDSSEDLMFNGNLVSDYDIDYDMGFLSDGDVPPEAPSRKRSGTDSPFAGLSSRIGSRLPSMSRWRSNSRARGNPMLSPSTELSLESVVLSGGPSSRSSSMSAPSRPGQDRMPENIGLPTPAVSYYGSTESVNLPTTLPAPIDIEKAQAHKERSSLERERGLATTPLLPPLMTSPLSGPPPESPLQSPTVAPHSATVDMPSPLPPSTHFPRPSLSTKPSVSSFRHCPNSPELPLPLPSILQEHDEWSDRLGHANFTITPQPYQPDAVNLEALRQLRHDWDLARCNYTKHLVRTGENYGETSKIYALTEAKWADLEKRWRTMHDNLMEQIVEATSSAPSSTSSDRSRSRGRGRARASSGGAALLGRPPTDDVFAGMQWRRLEDGLPSAIPRLVDADGKFPARGDEDIVGPMQRDEVMLRTHSEERKGARFWKNLAGKVGLRK
ncbi:hypothetical protein NW754_001657 [Fusarium falciforme]|uniref:Only prolin and serin are matching in the corresponding protein n=1 Tax=Fusarium falciforme TaxID=195108 RepID=A0A9W8RGD1_9HYPO|nr:Hypothetical protein NCS54_00184600 [Fusarium falciforme]KAJ4146193.1 hypothetical protein NW754_001657 [Fusarium falciforme]KAJ4195600.1 hypothetical protein NW755_001761 [Fusarium falciforme]KAJ4197221.1 hypothetical protein NW767_009113 [Fusarium falciforme]KAJ4259895.1 hypothetical protein NW757_001844 [Fusarium falciforme]WAO84626.1 Hypothetical protein NCS54_00184600 [Fusarium falciforme]